MLMPSAWPIFLFVVEKKNPDEKLNFAGKKYILIHKINFSPAKVIKVCNSVCREFHEHLHISIYRLLY